MSLLSNDYLSLFERYSEAIAVEKNGAYVFINEPAKKIISPGGTPRPFKGWVPSEILNSNTPGVFAYTEIDGELYLITMARLDDMRIYTISPQDKKNEQIDEELAHLSELIKPPLDALFTASSSMLPIVEGIGSEILSKNLAVIYQNYFKLLRVSEMLSSYREMRSGDISLKKTNVDLIALCKNLIDTVSLLTQEQGVRIRFSTSLGSADTEADFDRIEYVLLSIFENSLKHTKTGDDIKVTLSSTSSYYIVTVSIYGAVIPEEQLPKVFESSIHLHSAKTPDGNFIGLGLAFSAKIIEGHGGSMIIESRAGQSTEIKFTLPIKHGGGLADAPVRYGDKGMVPILTYLSDILPLDCYDAKFLD